jgi:serine/threonine-protein kinase RsbW
MHIFKTSCQREKLQEIRKFVSEVLHDMGFSENDAHKVILAVDEVCANMIIHSNNCNPAEKLELIISDENDNQVVFEIVDHGVGFDYTRYQEPDINKIIKNQQKGGLGIMLVKNIMDRVEFKCEEKRNICRMIKKFKKRDEL